MAVCFSLLFFFSSIFSCVWMEGLNTGWRGVGVGGGFHVPFPSPVPPRLRPAAASRRPWLRPLEGRGEGARLLQRVPVMLSLERACQFVKAFGERGGDLHVTERQHREVRLMPLYQRATAVRVLGDVL